MDLKDVMMRSAIGPSAGAATAMLLVGTSTAVSATIADFPVLGGQAIRYALAAALLLAVLYYRRPARIRLTVRDFLLLIGLAATGLVGFNIFLVEATRHASPALIGSIVGAVPIVLAIVGPLTEGRRPAGRTVVAGVIVTLGAAAAAGFGGGSLLGVLLALGALAGEVAFSLLAVPLLPKLGALRVAAYPTALSVPILIAASMVLEGTGALRVPTQSEAVAFAYLGVIVTAVAFFLWYSALRRLGPSNAGLFAGLVPVGALISTIALGIGEIRPAHVGGALLVAVGVAIGMSRPSRSSAARARKRAQKRDVEFSTRRPSS